MKSFLKIYIETLNLSFCFQRYLFILKLLNRRRYITVLRISFFFFVLFFLIYELNTVVSIPNNVFYPATSTLKKFNENKSVMYTFSGQDLLPFAYCVSFLFINVFLTNFLAFYDFPVLLYAMFFLPTNITKIDMKIVKIGELLRLELKIFIAAQPWWAASC